jgi:hypothetical protein
VDVFVRKLRGKLQRHSPGWNYIHTHFGIGYRFEPELAAGEGEPDLAPAGGEGADEGSPESLSVDDDNRSSPVIDFESARRR